MHRNNDKLHVCGFNPFVIFASMKNVLSILIICFAVASAMAQPRAGSQIELVQANSMEFDKSMGNAKRVIGDVIFKHENTYLYCDKAYLYSETNVVDAEGNVHLIMDRTTHAYGNTLHYDGKTGLARLDGNTRMVDGQTLLTTSYLDFDMRNDKVMYYTGGKIVDGETVLTSKLGTYDTKKKEMYFKKEVDLVNPEYTIKCDTLRYNTAKDMAYFIGPTKIKADKSDIYCERGWYNTKTDAALFMQNSYLQSENQIVRGDSLLYDKKNELGRAYKNVSMIDTVEDIMLKGDIGRFNQKTSDMLVTGHAVMVMIDNADSLFMHADTLISKGDSNARVFYAFHHARFFRADLQGASDSIVYSFADSSIYMYRKPIIWSDDNQMTADNIRIQMQNNRIDKMFFYNASFIVSEFDSIRYNQIKGKDMVASFKENDLYKIHVTGNAESIYYLTEKDSTVMGVNKSQSARLTIWVKDREIHRVTFHDKPEAILYPEAELMPADARLKGFLWQPVLRPKHKDDIF